MLDVKYCEHEKRIAALVILLELMERLGLMQSYSKNSFLEDPQWKNQQNISRCEKLTSSIQSRN